MILMLSWLRLGGFHLNSYTIDHTVSEDNISYKNTKKNKNKADFFLTFPMP